jgi:hypothetical protein
MRQVSKFLKLPSHERNLLFKIWILLWTIRIGLRFLPFLTLKNLLTKIGSILVGSNEKHPTDRLSWAVGVAGRRVPKATCLVQALAMHVLLQQTGHQACLHIGVEEAEEGGLKAHAWVESQGRVLIGGSGVDKYTPLLAME